MVWEKIALFFMIIFAMIGTGIVSLILHEYTHYNDFKEFNVTDERLCMIVIPTEKNFNNLSNIFKNPIAYYNFNYREELMGPEELAKFHQKEKITEVNAYTVGSLVFVFYMICYLIITFARYKDKKNILLYKYKIRDYEDYVKKLEKYIKNNDI